MIGRKVVSPSGIKGVVTGFWLASIPSWFVEKPTPKFVRDAIAAAEAAAGGPNADATAEAAYQACMSQKLEHEKRYFVDVWFPGKQMGSSYILSNGTHSKEQDVPKGNLIGCDWADQ